MICPVCGKELAEEMATCPVCGAFLPPVNSEQDSQEDIQISLDELELIAEEAEEEEIPAIVVAEEPSEETEETVEEPNEETEEVAEEATEETEEEIEEASEVFALPSGRYLIVEG